jgi:hypothetical protein
MPGIPFIKMGKDQFLFFPGDLFQEFFACCHSIDLQLAASDGKSFLQEGNKLAIEILLI